MTAPPLPTDPGMKFLNGLKTITGLAGVVGTAALQWLHPSWVQPFQGVLSHIEPIAYGVFGTLLALGLIHKAEKA